MNRFNNVLQKRINIENEERIAQDALKDKYGIEDRSKTVVIEKPSILKSCIRLNVRIIRTLSTILIIVFASIGILSLLVPETRNQLIKMFFETINYAL